MATATLRSPRTTVPSVHLPRFVNHESLSTSRALKEYGGEPDVDLSSFERTFMPDEVTRDFARRMHYAAYRAHKSRTSKDARRWMARYYRFRDGIVIGNRKLIYRAVRRRMAVSNRADDLIGDCHIVLIQAVAAYNPWLGVRFSTYAYTCLVRALSRISQKLSSDWLSRSMSIDVLPDGGPGELHEEPTPPGMPSIDQYLREGHPLLSPREKMIISLRFCMNETAAVPTLEKVGRDLGLSKERVRQVQACALTKLRHALLGEAKPGELPDGNGDIR